MVTILVIFHDIPIYSTHFNTMWSSYSFSNPSWVSSDHLIRIWTKCTNHRVTILYKPHMNQPSRSSSLLWISLCCHVFGRWPWARARHQWLTWGISDISRTPKNKRMVLEFWSCMWSFNVFDEDFWVGFPFRSHRHPSCNTAAAAATPKVESFRKVTDPFILVALELHPAIVGEPRGRSWEKTIMGRGCDWEISMGITMVIYIYI